MLRHCSRLSVSRSCTPKLQPRTMGWGLTTSSNGNFCVTGPLWRESTGHRWIPHTGQWRRTLMFSMFCTWTNSWANNRDTGDLRRHRTHNDITAMVWHKPLKDEVGTKWLPFRGSLAFSSYFLDWSLFLLEAPKNFSKTNFSDVYMRLMVLITMISLANLNCDEAFVKWNGPLNYRRSEGMFSQYGVMIPVSYRADSRFAASQWETVLLCNDFSHWLSAHLESALSCVWSICIKSLGASDVWIFRPDTNDPQVIMSHTRTEERLVWNKHQCITNQP